MGPPLGRTFAELLGSSEASLIEQAVRHYRERFAPVGLYENQPYADVAEGLAALRGDGHRLWVVTSKPTVFARRILDHFGLAARFEDVYGSSLATTGSEKDALVGEALRGAGLRAEGTWMVGDRALDVEGARAHGLRAVGVLWGYGSEDELRAARPHALVRSMAELREVIATP